VRRARSADTAFVSGFVTQRERGLTVRRSAHLRELPDRLWRDLARLSPWRVALLVTLLYGALVLGPAIHGRAGDFALVGHRYLDRSGMPASIANHARATSPVGYDGQFALFIALDPEHAAPWVDKPAYRYSHILYPLAARALALGRGAWIPVALLLVNLLAVCIGTLALALILRRNGEPPALAAAFGLFPGLFVAFQRDLGDVLAYSLVPVGILVLRWDRRSRVLLAAAVFAAAGLARESTLFFPAVLVLWQLAAAGAERRRALTACAFSVLAAAPYVVWRLFLLAWLGPSHSVPSGLAPLPLEGILSRWPWDAGTVGELLVVVVPGLLLGYAALGALRSGRRSPFLLLVLLQVLVFVVFLPSESYADYNAAGRLQLGAVVAALCCTPALRELAPPCRKSLRIGVSLALLPAVLFTLAAAAGGA
jgi:hypothetical protein